MGDKKQIGICLTSLQKNKVHESVNALCDGAKERGYDVHIFAPFSDLSNGEEGKDAQREIFQFIRYNRLDAVVIFKDLICNDNALADIVEYAKSENIPVIGVNYDAEGICRIRNDYKGAFAEIAEHVITAHGSTAVNFLGYAGESEISVEGTAAYNEVLTAHQMPIEEVRVGYVEGSSDSVVEYLNNYFYAGNYLPNAFICADDKLAVAVCNYFQKNNISIPGQTIITGFSNTSDRISYVPKITGAVTDQAATIEKIFEAFEGITSGSLAADSLVVVPCKIEPAATCGCTAADYEEPREIIKKEADEFAREKECFYDAMKLYSSSCSLRNVQSLADELPKYAVKAGISSYNVYLKSDYVEKIGIVSENVDNSVPLFWLSTFKDNDSTKINFSLDWDRFHKSKNMLRADSSQLMSVPLATDTQFFGFITIAYRSENIDNVYLYELIESISASLGLIFS